MSNDPESDLPFGVFNNRMTRKSESMQNLLSIDDDLSDRRTVFCKSCRKTNIRIRNNNFCTCSCTICIIVSLNLIMMIIILSFAIGFIIKNYSSMSRSIDFLDEIESIDIDQIKCDIDIVHNSVGEIKALADALSHIQNKTTFVNQLTYLVKYACVIAGC